MTLNVSLTPEHRKPRTLTLVFLPSHIVRAIQQKPNSAPFKPLTKKNKKRKPNSLHLESESQTLNPNRGTLD